MRSIFWRPLAVLLSFSFVEGFFGKVSELFATLLLKAKEEPIPADVDYVIKFTDPQKLSSSKKRKLRALLNQDVDSLSELSDIVTSRIRSKSPLIIQEFESKLDREVIPKQSAQSGKRSSESARVGAGGVSTKVITIGIPFELLCTDASEVGIYRDTMEGPQVFDEQAARAGVLKGFSMENQRENFTSAERQLMTYRRLMMMTDNQRRAILPQLQVLGVAQVYPLPDPVQRRELQSQLLRDPMSDSTLQSLSAYFGTDVSFYFAWLAFYIKWLIPLAMLSCYFLWSQTLSDSARLSTEHVMMALGLSIWASLFLEFWKRRSARLAHRWHVVQTGDESEGELLEEPQPSYHGQARTSPITGKQETYDPEYKLWLRYALTFPATFAMVGGVVITMLFAFWVTDRCNALAEEGYFSSYPAINKLVTKIPTTLYAITIPFYNGRFKEMASSMTEWENHRTSTGKQRAYVTKVALFTFFNSYLSLFYCAFVRQDLTRLRTQLSTILITTQITGQLTEVLGPYFSSLLKVNRKLLRKRKTTSLTTFKTNANQQSSSSSSDSIPSSSSSSASTSSSSSSSSPSETSSDLSHELRHRSRVSSSLSSSGAQSSEESPQTREEDVVEEEDFVGGGVEEGESDQPRVSPIESEGYQNPFPKYLYEEWSEMVFQFGYVALFGWCWAWAPVCALLNNWVEIRTDGWKMTTAFQRPHVHNTSSIGIWYTLLNTLSILAVATNFGVIAVYIFNIYPTLPALSSSGSSEMEWLDRFALLSIATKAIVLLVGEHLVFALKVIIAAIVPDVPSDVAIDRARRLHATSTVLRRHASLSLMSRASSQAAGLSEQQQSQTTTAC